VLVVARAAPPAAGDWADGLREARVVLVPVDASPPALEALDVIADALDGPERGRQPDSRQASDAPRLRVVMARVLPRRVDRWAVVERLAERYPGALYVNTVPLGRRPAGDDAGGARPATLYAPSTRAAAAYAALAREVAADLGMRL
jgi:cellulose biosynthesis protein BcsQ